MHNAGIYNIIVIIQHETKTEWIQYQNHRYMIWIYLINKWTQNLFNFSILFIIIF